MTLGRRLLPATVVATFGLILLGIYTAAIGAGLTCDARWPLCDGAVFGLFPANWTSFVEWFHRLVAMITGFMILGSWWAVWRSGRSRRSVWAMSLAVALLPIQIWLGAETVWQYEILTLTAHFLTALLIFGALIVGTWWWSGWSLTLSRARRVLGLVVVLAVPFVLLTPRFLFVHGGVVQITYYGIGLVMFAGLVIVGLEATSMGRGLLAVSGLGVGLLAIQMVAGRLVRSPMIETIDWAAALLFVGVLAAGLWISKESRKQQAVSALSR